MNECKPNCFEKTEVGGAFFIFHQITDELSTKHEPRLRTTIHLFPILNRIDWLFKLGLNMGFTIDKNRRGKNESSNSSSSDRFNNDNHFWNDWLSI